MTTGSDIYITAAKTDITPDRPLPLFGRLGRVESSQNTASRLEANCILVRTAQTEQALVTIDSLYPSAALSNAILTKLATNGWLLQPKQLLTVASHTHNAPALDSSKPLLGLLNSDYLDMVAGRIADCLADCRAKPGHPLSLQSGAAPCNASIFRRRFVKGFDFAAFRIQKRLIMAPQPAEVIDQNLKLLAFTTQLGAVQALLWSWPCHAVSENEKLSVSADFPGFVREYLRQKYRNRELPVLYFPGFSGDIRPATTAALPLHKNKHWLGIGPRFASNHKSHQDTLHDALKLSIEAARKSLRCVPVPDRSGLKVCRTEIDLSDIRDGSDAMHPLSVDHWKIGPVKIVSVSAEVSNRYRIPLDDNNPLHFTTGCAQQVFGYIPTDKQILEGGYEAGGFEAAFSVPGCFHKKIEAVINEAINLRG